MLQVNYVSSSPLRGESQPCRGFVDRLDEDGVEGWAVDLDQVSVPVTLELLVEGDIVARCTTAQARTDLSQYLGSDARPGFSFDPAALTTLRRLHLTVPNARVWIQIAGTELTLRSTAGITRLADVFDNAGNRQGGRIASTRELLARMSRHSADASERLQRPFRPSPANTIGVIEAAMPDRANIWLIGWMRRGEPTDQPVVILDRQKIPGAMAFFYFERDDLPADACGFIGLLTGGWLPIAGRKAHLFFGVDQQLQLEMLSPLLLLDGQAFAEWLDDRLPSASGPNVVSLQHILANTESWSLRGGTGFAATAAIDSILVVPQFGVLAEGWVLCPSKRWVGITFRFGDTVLGCDPASIRRKPRHDLLDAAKGLNGVVSAAGFTAVFPGLLPIAEINNPVFKVIYEDGTTSNHTVDPDMVARMGPSATLDEAARMFPALMLEPFFPTFARGLIEDLGPISRAWSAHKIAPSLRVVAVTLPRNRCDIFLLFTELVLLASAAGPTVGVVFLAESGEMRPVATQLFTQFAANTAIPASLFFLEDADYALYALPAILVEVGAESFAFFGRPAIPTQAGWNAALGALDATGNPGPVVLRAYDPVMPGPGSVSIRCFTWNRWAFADWLADQPRLLGGGAGLDGPDRDGRNVPGAARLLTPIVTPRLIAAANAAAVV